MHCFINFKFILGSTFLFGVINVATAGEQCIGVHNGCSSRGFFESYKILFTPACNEHDACYYCGHHFNITQSQCDKYFYQDMKKLCVQNGGWGCSANAFIYYSATRVFGIAFYTDFFFPICKRDCVKNMLIRDHNHTKVETSRKKRQIKNLRNRRD